MNSKAFETFMAKMLRKQDYRVIQTQLSNDQGADLICEKDDTKIAIQLKCWKGTVGNSAVQEIVAAKNHYKCDEAWIITNSTLTKPAIALSKSNKVKIIDRKQLIEFINN